MDTFVDQRDFALIERDKYSFFVLGRILKGECALILSDHQKIIICWSRAPFPVWIWTPDDLPDADKEKVFLLAKKHFLVDKSHQFNMKYSLAQYFIRRSDEEGVALKIARNLFAYDCPAPKTLQDSADGHIYQCCKNQRDILELTDFMYRFYEEAGLGRQEKSAYLNDAQKFIEAGSVFFWKNADGVSVATCKYYVNSDLASINLVMTLPEHRRRHYAQSLVHAVTEKIRGQGLMPMLYTDADYAASNACYEKIGYVLREKLCTLGAVSADD